MEKALIIRKPWIDKILDDGKIWEMRATKTKVRGRIGLIEAGSGLIVGEVTLVDSLDPATADGFMKHHIEDESLLKKWPYPWVMSKPVRYEKPIPYKHPQGAVIWVKLDTPNK